MIDKNLIEACIQNKRNAQRQLYEIIAPKLYQTCRRYIKDQEVLEEILADSCYKVLTKLPQLKDPNAFVGWARSIAVHNCLAFYKKQAIVFENFEDAAAGNSAQTATENAESSLNLKDILKLLHQLPMGCKMVFNLFIIEGYSHAEIAQLMQISIGTSKSQLNFAKHKMQNLIHQFNDLKMQLL